MDDLSACPLSMASGFLIMVYVTEIPQSHGTVLSVGWAGFSITLHGYGALTTRLRQTKSRAVPPTQTP